MVGSRRSGLRQSSGQSKQGQSLAALSVVQFGQWSVFKVNRSDHLGSASPYGGSMGKGHPEPLVLSG